MIEIRYQIIPAIFTLITVVSLIIMSANSLLTDSDIDIEEELERDRNETPISEVDQDDDELKILKDSNEPHELDQNDAFLQIKNFKKSAHVLSAAEQTLQSQILLLCSAIGGVDLTSGEKRYRLGVDALACLKDIKRWIKAVDEATKTWHVAAACHENSLIEDDLIPIMIETPKRINDENKNYMQNVMLSSLELLVALTKPLTLDTETASPQLMDLYMMLKKEYLRSKDKILNYKNGKCLKAVVGIALPILKLPKDQRSNRDTVVLNLCLHFFRNVIRIVPADFTISKKKTSSRTQQIVDNMPQGITREDISFDNLLIKFQKNKVLMFIQTITAGLSSEFNAEVLSDVCLDIYFYLTFQIDPNTLFDFTQKTISATSGDKGELASLMEREKEMKHNLFSNKITRHANFGTLVSIKDGSDENAVTVGTQRNFAFTDPLDELDSKVSKKQAASRFKRRDKESTKSDFDTSLDVIKQRIHSQQAATILKKFCSDFTEAGFTLLIMKIRRLAISSSARLGAFTEFHFLYLMMWILQFENLQRKKIIDSLSYKRYGYIMICLEEQMIRLLLVSSLPRYLQNKEYNLLQVATGCFKQILLTTISMHSLENLDVTTYSDSDKDEVNEYVSLSETVLRNIFANEEIIDILFKVPEDAHKVSLKYAVDMLDYTHVLLKVLHYLSHLKVPIVLAKRIKQTRKRYYGNDPTISDSDDDYEPTSEQLKRFKILDKGKYSALEDRLFHERIVDAFIWVFCKFNEVKEETIKQCISYFTKLLLKWKDHFLKFVRLDFMLALHDIRKAHYSKETTRSLIKLLSYFMRVLEKLHRHSKSILLEAMTLHQEHETDVSMYLLGGDLLSVHEKQVQVRAPDLKFSEENMSLSYKISLLVSSLCYRDETELVQNLIDVLRRLKDERSGNYPPQEGDNPPSSPVKRAGRQELPVKFIREQRKDATMRLLLQEVGFIGHILPATVTDEHLNNCIDFMDEAIKNPMESFEIEGKLVSKNPELDQMHHESEVVIETSGTSEAAIEKLEAVEKSKNESKQSEDENLQYADDNLDALEARLAANENHRKGVAHRKGKKRIVDSEDDDEISFPKRYQERRKKRKLHRRSKEPKEAKKAEKETSEPKKHLSSKYVDVEDDKSDSEEEKQFFAREQRLLEMVHKNGDKPLTPDQFNAMFHPELSNTDSESDEDDLDMASQEKTTGDAIDDDEMGQDHSTLKHKRRRVIDDDDDE